jgi:iron complex outermembrane receptor protein
MRTVRVNVYISGALGAMAMASLVPMSSVSAQDTKADAPAEATGLQDITVTARRREEKLETVPIAVSAFSNQALEAQNTRSLVDISRNTPSFQFQNQAGGGSGRNDRSLNNITFRGLFLGNVSPISQGGLVFVDGAPVINGATPTLEDVQRVEVLKGPQSVYFGRSTFTGAINFVTKDPSFEFGGHVKAMYGTYGSNQASISVDVPIVDDMIALRLSGSHDKKGGQYTNFADRNQTFGTQQSDTLSGQLLVKPTDHLRLKAFLSYQHQNDGPPAQAALKKGEFNCNLGGTYGNYFCGALPNNLPGALISGNYAITPATYRALITNPNGYPTIFGSDYLKHGGLKRDVLQASLRGDYDFENGMTLSSITAWHRDKQASILDLVFRDSSNFANVSTIPNAPASKQWLLMYQSLTTDFSQEVRLTSSQDSWIRWTAGANYFHADYKSGVIYGVSPFGYSNSSTRTDAIPSTPAVFGAVYISPVPAMTISLEGRYQWDHIKQNVLGTSTGALLTTPLELKETYKSFSPRASIDYKLTPGTMVYATFSRGYRPGGFNAALALLRQSAPAVYAQLTANGGADAYNQEKIDNFEGGIKSRFWNNKASIRATVYYDQYKDGQVANSIPYFPAGSATVNLLSVIQNIGRVNLKGLELEGDLAPLRGLTFNGTLGINDSKIKSYVCQECLYIKGTTNAVGNQLSGAPKWTWTFGTSYEHPITPEWTAFTRVDYRHRGRQYVDTANVAYSRNDDQVDLRFGARRKDFSIEAFVTNLFNEQTLTGFQSSDLLSFSGIAGYSTGATSDIRLALPDKRRMGVRASFDF